MSRKYALSFVVLLSLLFSLAGCNLPGLTQPAGTIKIVNTHVRSTDVFPGGRRLPITREYGICIINYALPLPAWFSTPDYDLILAKDSSTTTYDLPPGTYQVQEFQFDSEINTDPTYSPEYITYVRPVETILVVQDQTILFGSERSILPAPGNLVEGPFLNNRCNNLYQQQLSWKQTTTARAAGSSTPRASTPTSLPPTITAKVATATPTVVGGAWVLKMVTPDVGKKEMLFSSSAGVVCSGGTKATSTETNATTTASGGCQLKNTQTANSKTQHTWSRPPDRLVPGQELTGTLTASSTGICSWQAEITETMCRGQTSTNHAAWIGEGLPGGTKEFPYQNLVYGNDYATSARAADQPTGSYKWKIPTGGGSGRTTLLLQYKSTSYNAYVYTNFWYEWSDK